MWWLLVGIILLGVAVSLWYSLAKGAPWIPTTGAIRKRMLDCAKLAPGELLLDLGAGDGRILIEAVKRYGARAIGYEVNPVLVWFAKCRIWCAGLARRAHIEHSDLFTAPIPDAAVVTLFLLQDTNQRVRRELVPRFRPGTRVVSYAFTFEGLEPVAIERFGWGPPIYLYHL